MCVCVCVCVCVPLLPLPLPQNSEMRIGAPKKRAAEDRRFFLPAGYAQAHDGSAKQRAAPGMGPGTSRTRSENHATRPSSLLLAQLSYCYCENPCRQLIRKRDELRSGRCYALINGIASHRLQLARLRARPPAGRAAARQPSRAAGGQCSGGMAREIRAANLQI